MVQIRYRDRCEKCGNKSETSQYGDGRRLCAGCQDYNPFAGWGPFVVRIGKEMMGMVNNNDICLQCGDRIIGDESCLCDACACYESGPVEEIDTLGPVVSLNEFHVCEPIEPTGFYYRVRDALALIVLKFALAAAALAVLFLSLRWLAP